MDELIKWYNIMRMKQALHSLEKYLRKVRKNGDYRLDFKDEDYLVLGGADESGIPARG